MKFLRCRTGRVVTGFVLVFALFLARPGAQRLRTRIVRSISLALGRQVDVGWVKLRILPRPGFELENFVVHDDPAFGAEPVLQSSDVVATVRVSSLLAGRLEVSRLSLAEPSLNLVRNSEGRWNLQSLLERAAKIPSAPTSRARNEARPSFPYIEAEHGRLNFKFGPEKKPYALTEANFALWQDSENAWGLRLRAQPMRTDFNLSDTGNVELDGTWQRAARLGETPLQFSLQWEGAQLGQATKLTFGQDKGWRGAIKFSAALTGTPEDLMLDADTSIQDFRRYDIAGGKALRLAARCGGHYSSTDHVLSRISCRVPVGDGTIGVNGRLAAGSEGSTYDLTVLARNLPVQSLVEFARRTKKNVPADISASGKLEGRVSLRRELMQTSIATIWQGAGEVLDFGVRSPVDDTKLVLARIPFTVSSGISPEQNPHAERNRMPAIQLNTEPHLDLGPFNLALARLSNATVQGQFSRSGYNIQIQGDGEVQRLLELARTVGLPTLQPTATGEARVNLRMDGTWAGFAAPVVTGTAQLHAIHARVRGLNEPVEIVSADVLLTPNTAVVQKLMASAAGSTWWGSLSIPRECDVPNACPIRFDIRTDEIETDELRGVGNPVAVKQPWYRFLARETQSSLTQSKPFLGSLHAIGKLTAGRVLVGNVIASRVSAEVELEQGQLHLSHLRGDIWGGRHTGEWRADFSVNPPAFSGTGTLEKVALSQVAETMHDGWITGAANVDYRASTHGWGKEELVSNADASLQLDVREGSFPHVTLVGESGLLRINRFAGRLLLRDGKFEIEQGKLQTPSSIYQLSGTASLNRVLDIKLARDGTHGFNVTGTLDDPRVAVSTTADTQAALKP